MTDSFDITIESRITARDFRDFAVYDTLVRQKRMKSPIIFCCIFLGFALVCWLLRSFSDQAEFMAAFLAVVGIIIPLIYFHTFLRSITAAVAKYKLSAEGKHFYTVRLTDAPDGITVDDAMRPSGTLRLKWDQLFMVLRKKNVIYLYPSDRQAFILPAGQASVDDDTLWQTFLKMLPGEKCTDKR